MEYFQDHQLKYLFYEGISKMLNPGIKTKTSLLNYPWWVCPKLNYNIHVILRLWSNIIRTRHFTQDSGINWDKIFMRCDLKKKHIPSSQNLNNQGWSAQRSIWLLMLKMTWKLLWFVGRKIFFSYEDIQISHAFQVYIFCLSYQISYQESCQ